MVQAGQKGELRAARLDMASARQPESLASSPSSSSLSSPATTARSSSPLPVNGKTKIAIIGSGLTGLSAAYYLCTSSCASSLEVHLFERASKIGLDSNSITLGQETRIDVPMRSLNEGYYPNVMRLYRELDIPLRKSDFTYAFAQLHRGRSKKQGRHGPIPRFLYEGSSGLKGFALPSSLSPWRSISIPEGREILSSPIQSTWLFIAGLLTWFSLIQKYLSGVIIFAFGYLHLLVVSLWYHHTGSTRNSSHPIARHTLRSYYKGQRFFAGFLDDVVVPLFSAMMTVQAQSVLESPVADIFDYVALTFGRSHYTVAEGVQEVERRISEPFEKELVHVDCTVTSLERSQGNGKVKVVTSEETYDGFDQVVLATQANQSAVFVDSYIKSLNGPQQCQEKQRLQEMCNRLKTFKYEDSQVVNHTDRSILPADQADWRDLNLVSPGESSRGMEKTAKDKQSRPTLSDDTHTMASHIIHHCQSPSTPTLPPLIIQTTNPLSTLQPDPSTVLSVSNFERAVLTLEGNSSQGGLFDWRRSPTSKAWDLQLGALQGTGDGDVGPGIWVCGSWSPGIPLLEGCVVSSRLVVDAMLNQKGHGLQ